ncbi:MAG: hypothetical protein KJO78_05175 [Alphaproteobacteria bacterium]|nr:hypothetical protein [Alphaproteobacteria bacterium]
MAEILKRTEATPAAYPAVPSGLSVKAAALDSDMVWQRIESFIAHRWTDRQVVWTVEGPGCFEPDLTPATITAMDLWQSDAWQPVALVASPLGGQVLPGEGPYRFTADVGSGAVPAAVSEAFKRLAEYMAPGEEHPGASSYSVQIPAIHLEETRSAAWLAKALQLSGAADLLRPYRRA